MWMHARHLAAAVVATLVLNVCASATGADELEPIEVASVGPPQVIYNTGRDGCSPYDIPDESAHAFRDASGTVHFLMTTSSNREFVGPDLEHLKHVCDLVYKGAESGDPSAYDDHGWISAFSAEGSTVYGLVHNEYHAYEKNKPLCTLTGGASTCSEVALTEVVSHDGGYHFSRFPGDRGLVAVLPYRFHEEKHWWGYMGPSNIVKRGDDYYAMVSVIQPNDRSRNGVCVLHTRTIADPNSWRGWDGSAYTLDLSKNPYHASIADPNALLCRQLPRGEAMFSLGSLVWSPARQSFLLLARTQQWDHPVTGEVPGAYLMESKDLLHWSKPVLVLSDADAGEANLYPSLIDPSSPDQSFSTIGDRVLLFTMTGTGKHGYADWSITERTVRLRL